MHETLTHTLFLRFFCCFVSEKPNTLGKLKIAKSNHIFVDNYVYNMRSPVFLRIATVLLILTFAVLLISHKTCTVFVSATCA